MDEPATAQGKKRDCTWLKSQRNWSIDHCQNFCPKLLEIIIMMMMMIIHLDQLAPYQRTAQAKWS
jgi:hypothetical protein